MTRKYETSVVVCARWENDYIVEFLRYHKLIGYSHVYLYCNDDEPEALYEKVFDYICGPDPFVTFHHMKFQGLQNQIYLHFLRNHLDESEWISFLDVDEFLNIRDGRSVSDLVRDFKDADCVLFNWLVFGTNNHKTYPQGAVLENYTRRGRRVYNFTKFICRSEVLADDMISTEAAYGFWHNPKKKTYRPARVVNVLNHEVEALWTYNEEESDELIAIATVHHYMFKSEEYLRHRVSRGTGGAFGGQTMWAMSESTADNINNILIESNAVVDESLAGFWTQQWQKSRNPDYAPLPGHLLSAGKNCTQSSLSAWSAGKTKEEDAARAVNGILDGKQKFHTDNDDAPWWQIDLGKTSKISGVFIYNVAFTVARRFKNFRISVSHDQENWRTVKEKIDGVTVGSVADPFRWEAAEPIEARYLRITSLDKNFLHLDQVEVYGFE